MILKHLKWGSKHSCKQILSNLTVKTVLFDCYYHFLLHFSRKAEFLLSSGNSRRCVLASNMQNFCLFFCSSISQILLICLFFKHCWKNRPAADATSKKIQNCCTWGQERPCETFWDLHHSHYKKPWAHYTLILSNTTSQWNMNILADLSLMNWKWFLSSCEDTY